MDSRGAQLLSGDFPGNAALVENCQAVSQAQPVGQIVGDHQDGPAARRFLAQEFIQQPDRFLVQPRVGLVQEQDFRFMKRGPGDGQALYHAARKRSDRVALASE